MNQHNVMDLASSAIRSLIVAPPGRKLCIADLANIEGRAIAWLADEAWKLQAFREFDAGKGADIYKLAYAKSFGIPADQVNKSQRQIGKVQELMLAYQGSVGAYLTGAATYGFDIADLAESVRNATPDKTWRDTADSYDWFQKKNLAYGLPVEHWTACKVLVDAWRAGHPNTVALWSALGDVFKLAVARRGETIAAGKHLKVRCDGSWLRIRLPSGRYICYLSPEVDQEGNCSFMGVDQYTKQWKRIRTYSGKLAENCTQAVARDVLFYNMPSIEKAGYSILLSVHDELLTETPDSDDFSSDALAALMSADPGWAKGLPLAAAGFETKVYRKD